MPRPNKHKDFIGPRFENGGVFKPLVITSFEDRQSRKCLRKAERVKKAQSVLNSGSRPKSLVVSNKSSSVDIWERQTKWLDKNVYVLSVFHQSLVQAELDRQKAIARASGNRRKERILENGYEFYTVTQVLVLYGKDCHLCHEPIDLKASRRVGIGDWLLGLHIDHLIAVANGGPDTLANVRPSHAICNLRKGST